MTPLHPSLSEAVKAKETNDESQTAENQKRDSDPAIAHHFTADPCGADLMSFKPRSRDTSKPNRPTANGVVTS